jgi:hypothetical protein
VGYAAVGSDAIVETLSSIIFYYISRCKDTKSLGKLVVFRREISKGTQMAGYVSPAERAEIAERRPSQMAIYGVA